MIILSLITVDQSQTSIFHMFQYHYLGPDDWLDAAGKFQDGPQLFICVLMFCITYIYSHSDIINTQLYIQYRCAFLFYLYNMTTSTKT